MSSLLFFWSFVIIEPIHEFLKIYMRVTDEAKLTETSSSGPEKFDTSRFQLCESVHCSKWAFLLHSLYTAFLCDVTYS